MYKKPMSKYKNSSAKIVKKEQSLTGVSTNRLSNTIGSLINCSLKHVTFAFDSSSGGSICTINYDDFAKRLTFSNDGLCVTHAHSGPITDIQYNTFRQSLMATSGYDSQIQLWNVEDSSDEPGMYQTVKVSPQATLPLNESRCDCVQWNPNVNSVLVSTSLNTIYLWDVESSPESPTYSLRNHSDAIQGVSWKRDGALLVTTSKDKTMQIVDPRNMSSGENLRFENTKTANKDSKVVWIGTSDSILSSVYTQSHQREVHLWDIRNTSAPVYEMQIDTGNNVLAPLYDYDTQMLFLIGKAETMVRYCEVFTGDDCNIAFNSTQPVDDQIKAACLMPKFGLDIMKCEIDRLLLLTRSSVYPLPYYVPRRSYFDFHADVFPETYNVCQAGIDKDEWLKGGNAPAVKVALNPSVQKQYFTSGSIDAKSASPPNTPNTPNTPKIVEFKQPVAPTPTPVSTPAATTTTTTTTPSSTGSVSGLISSLNKSNSTEQQQQQQQSSLAKPAATTPTSSSSAASSNASSVNTTPAVMRRNIDSTPSSTTATTATPSNGHSTSSNVLKATSPNTNGANDRKSRVKSVYYQSKFKYINGKAAHKTEHITNIRNLSTMWSSECNGFQINAKHAAYLLSGTSGQIGILELDKPGRLNDATINSLVNKSKVADFAWDPFDDETLAAACDNGIINIWKIPEDGLVESMEEPTMQLQGHLERLYCIKYHPYARNVLATASYDRTIKVWNVDTQQAVQTLRGHTDVIFSFSWSLCGQRLATICKDGVIRVYEPLVSEEPVVESKCGPASGSKAARIEWCLNDRMLLVSGFGKGNLRQIYLFESDTLEMIVSEDINPSPSLLIPYYDSDISVLYLYAKGEETLYLYEIQEEEPFFQVLTPFKPDGLHFAITFLPKLTCDVKTAEIAKAYRLTKDNRVERMSFTVPRVKLGLFQDDIYPDTIDRRKPYLSAAEWFSGAKFQLSFINLQPSGMQRLTDTQSNEPIKPKSKPIKKFDCDDSQSQQKGELFNPDNLNTDEKKIINSMLQRATLFYKPSEEENDENSEWVRISATKTPIIERSLDFEKKNL